MLLAPRPPPSSCSDVIQQITFQWLFVVHWTSVGHMARRVPISVVETPEFLSATRKLMSDDERRLLVDYLAHNPTAGDLIAGTGGIRKIRWGSGGAG